MDECVYMTVLTTATYLPGVRALKRSLKKVKSEHKLVVLVPDDQMFTLGQELGKSGITDDFCKIEYAAPIEVTPPDGVSFSAHYWANTLFKLRVASCIRYRKIVLLDSDLYVCKNIDHLFERPHFSAVCAGKSCNPDWVDLNSGLMVIVPSERFFKQLVESIAPAMVRVHKLGRNFGDQDVFHEAFPEWRNHGELHLPEIYNCIWDHLPKMCRLRVLKMKDVSVIHFTGEWKPWMIGSLKQMVRLIRAMLLFYSIRQRFLVCRYIGLAIK